MLSNILNSITEISSDDTTNTENYLEALPYIDNLYELLNILKDIIDINQIKFLPSFKGKYTVEKLGIASSAEENEMKVFIITSELFSENNKYLSKLEQCATICKVNNNSIKIILN